MGNHSKPQGLKSFHDFSSVTVACENLGTSASLGSLAVPSAWPMATATGEATQPAADAAAASRPQWVTYQDSLMGMMTGSHATSQDGADEGHVVAD